MELYEEILKNNQQQHQNAKDLPNMQTEKICYQILKEIQKIIADPTLTDAECFWRVEELVCLFEKYGLDYGGRHDF